MTAVYATTLDPKRLREAIEAHEACFNELDVRLLTQSPWYPSLLKVLQLLGNYFVSDKSEASSTSKDFVKSHLKELGVNVQDAPTSADLNGVDSCVLQLTYPFIHALITPKFIPSVEDLVQLTKEVHNDAQVDALVADNGSLFNDIHNQLERIVSSVMDYLEVVEGGSDFLKEVEVIKDARETMAVVSDEVDLAIFEQLVAIARQMIETDVEDDATKAGKANANSIKSGTQTGPKSASNRNETDAAAVEHILSLFAQVLDRLRANVEIWDELRSVCIDREVSTEKLQATLLATVHYGLSKAFEALPTEDEIRRRFHERVKKNVIT